MNVLGFLLGAVMIMGGIMTASLIGTRPGMEVFIFIGIMTAGAGGWLMVAAGMTH